MNVLITGGTGFLGQRVVVRLQREGHRVLGLARSTASQAALQRMKVEPLRGDLDVPRTLKLSGIDAVVHAAAHFRLAGPRRPFFRTNVRGTKALLAAAKKAGVRHFIGIGAAAVVMDNRGSPLDNVDESAPTFPRSFSPYIASKAQAEKLILDAHAPDFRTVVLRPPGIWGPGDAFARALTEGGAFAFISRGDYPYVTCHVDNVAEAVACALTVSAGGRAYFINDSEPTTFRAFALSIADAVGVDLSHAPSVPYGLAWYSGLALEFLWWLGGARQDPPLSRTLVRLIGRPSLTNDAAARRDLGYRGMVTRADGIAALKSRVE
jgi:nucleoside-diphosphate-sugar epimerase